uniref:carbonic anhydrase n=1 Tax=Plectus sambesii TaxID=2011161 RepID=A0A914W0G7_9BILA
MHVLLFAFLLGFLKQTDASSAERRDHAWGYDGANGPDSWPAICHTGRRQSPIDINPARVAVVNLPQLNFINYDRMGNILLTNNGHTVTTTGYDRWPNPPYIFGGGLDGKYNLVGLHFHWGDYDYQGSEHTFDLLHYPLEAHFVHQKDGLNANQSLLVSNGMAVVSIFFKMGGDGNALRQFEDAFRSSDAYESALNVSNVLLTEILPANTLSFYRYDGSLTTPGCNEAVVWTILAEPMSVSEQQVLRAKFGI